MGRVLGARRHMERQPTSNGCADYQRGRQYARAAVEAIVTDDATIRQLEIVVKGLIDGAFRRRGPGGRLCRQLSSSEQAFLQELCRLAVDSRSAVPRVRPSRERRNHEYLLLTYRSRLDVQPKGPSRKIGLSRPTSRLALREKRLGIFQSHFRTQTADHTNKCQQSQSQWFCRFGIAISTSPAQFPQEYM
jgi:hypothetical protein